MSRLRGALLTSQKRSSKEIRTNLTASQQRQVDEIIERHGCDVRGSGRVLLRVFRVVRRDRGSFGGHRRHGRVRGGARNRRACRLRRAGRIGRNDGRWRHHARVRRPERHGRRARRQDGGRGRPGFDGRQRRGGKVRLGGSRRRGGTCGRRRKRRQRHRGGRRWCAGPERGVRKRADAEEQRQHDGQLQHSHRRRGQPALHPSAAGQLRQHPALPAHPLVPLGHRQRESGVQLPHGRHRLLHHPEPVLWTLGPVERQHDLHRP